MKFHLPLVLLPVVLSACASGPLVPMGDPGRDASLKEFKAPQSAAVIYIFRSERTA